MHTENWEPTPGHVSHSFCLFPVLLMSLLTSVLTGTGKAEVKDPLIYVPWDV